MVLMASLGLLRAGGRHDRRHRYHIDRQSAVAGRQRACHAAAKPPCDEGKRPMDQRTHDVEKDLKNILQTRMALGDKIQTLERHVEATVESTKMAALDALDLARNKAATFIESTTNHLNPAVQAGRRPWMMVGSAIAVGFFAGLLEQRRRAGVYRYYPPASHAADVMPERGRSREPKGVYPFY